MECSPAARLVTGAAAALEHEPEDALRDLDVLGQQRKELLGGERQADGRLNGLHGLLGGTALNDRFEADDVGSRDLSPLAAGRAAATAIEKELDRVHRFAGFVDHAVRLVANLATQEGDAEQLVD